MAYQNEHLPKFIKLVTETVGRNDLQRTDWRRQTDAVQLTCILAQMVSEDDDHVFLVDGRIETSLIRDAVSSGDPKKFFSQRCHDKGLKCRRVIILDTKSRNGMDEKANKISNLHFHGIFMLDSTQDKKWLLHKLREVFGAAYTLGARQFIIKNQNPDLHYTYAGRRGTGISGKLGYMLAHAGTTHAILKLNEGGKRSRKAPKTRRTCNKKAKGLAAGVPSNFLRSITICDNISKREGRKAFEAWMMLDALQEACVVSQAVALVTKQNQMQNTVDYDLPGSAETGIVGPGMTGGPLYHQRASLEHQSLRSTARTP